MIAGSLNPPTHLIEQLKALDPGLFLAFCEWRLDYRTMQPLIRRNGRPIFWPRWHVFLDRNGKTHHLFAWEVNGEYAVPDERIVAKIRFDAGRHMTADQINRMIDDKLTEAENRRRHRMDDLRDQEIRANKGFIRDVLENDPNLIGPPATRSATIYSYDGQENRATRFGGIPLTDKEVGWEKPDYEKEMQDA
jgi:hypothetical protein